MRNRGDLASGFVALLPLSEFMWVYNVLVIASCARHPYFLLWLGKVVFGAAVWAVYFYFLPRPCPQNSRAELLAAVIAHNYVASVKVDLFCFATAWTSFVSHGKSPFWCQQLDRMRASIIRISKKARIRNGREFTC